MEENKHATKLLRVNLDKWACDLRCEECYRFFECPNPRRTERYLKRMQAIAENLKDVKQIIPVLSGKGGVGKSIISANLAIGLAHRGYSVAIMDSDLHGPSIPSILGMKGRRLLSGSNGMVPPQAALGVKVVSMDFLGEKNRPMTWLSDIKRNAQEQFLANTAYGRLDYLIIDMPPGTGSETVNLLKYLPQMSGVIIVTMAADVAEQVVQRCISLCRKAKVPIIGLIENMSSIVCPHCGETYVGTTRSPQIAAHDVVVPLLGRIARDPLVVESADKGKSFLLLHPDAEISKGFYRIVTGVEKALNSSAPGSPLLTGQETEAGHLSKILEINYDPSCRGRSCFRCTDYFVCTLPKKENIDEYRMIKSIRNSLSGIHHKIAVMSCKGGVGKSTLSVNFAAAVAKKGKSAVILDCDFHGPCIPKMLGIASRGMRMQDSGVIPVSGISNVGVVSMDFLLSAKEALTWFDPLKKMTVAQFLYSVDYGNRDYLIVDLPPGTGAESYAILQFLSDLDGALIITQPSESPQKVASKSIELCRQAKVPVLGLVENMSCFVCSKCRKTSRLSGRRDAEELAVQKEVPFLGRIPMEGNIYLHHNDGVPFVIGFPESVAAQSVLTMADTIMAAIETVPLSSNPQ